MKATRRRYTYANRADAEDAAAKAQAAECRALAAVGALISGATASWPKPIGCYRVRMVARAHSVLLIIWQPAATSGAPEVHDAEAYAAWMNGEAGQFNADGRRVAFHARRIVAAFYKRQQGTERDAETLAAAIAEEFQAS